MHGESDADDLDEVESVDDEEAAKAARIVEVYENSARTRYGKLLRIGSKSDLDVIKNTKDTYGRDEDEILNNKFESTLPRGIRSGRKSLNELNRDLDMVFGKRKATEDNKKVNVDSITDRVSANERKRLASEI